MSPIAPELFAAPSLSELQTFARQRRRLLALCWLICAVIVVLLFVFLPRSYLAKTLILPPVAGQSTSAGVISALAGATSLAGGAAAALTKQPEDLYVGILRSTSISREIVKKFDLVRRYEVKFEEDAIRELKSKLEITADRRSGLITVSVRDEDPKIAAGIANASLYELRTIMNRVARMDAQQRANYFGEKVQEVLQRFTSTEAKLREVSKKDGVATVDTAISSQMNAAVALRSQLLTLRAQLSARGAFLTDQSPEQEKLRAEIRSITQQLKLIEGEDFEFGVSRQSPSPALSVYRELKYFENLLLFITQQQQAAIMDESKDAPLVQQVDVAVVAERPVFPKLWMAALFFLVLGAMATAGSFLRHRYLQSTRRVGE